MRLGDFLAKLVSDSEDLKPGETVATTITRVTGGANLVDGKPTYELAETQKHALDTMKRCCDAEIATWRQIGWVPAPYYFERVAILSRKHKDYRQEVEYCERYIDIVEQFRREHPGAPILKSPRYAAIKARLPKARQLLDRDATANEPD